MPALSIWPHDGVGGLTPRPRNESDASSRIAQVATNAACTSSGPRQFGRMVRNRMRGVPAPIVRAATTYSRTFSCITLARASRAKAGMLTMVTASAPLIQPVPITAINPMASKMAGNASTTSIARISSESAIPSR